VFHGNHNSLCVRSEIHRTADAANSALRNNPVR
jgi:hypothetical protein